MVKMKYICEKCGKDNFKNISAAKVHEKIPIKEGDYVGLVFKDVLKKYIRYRVCFIKTNEVSKERHERIFGFWDFYSTKNMKKLEMESFYSEKVSDIEKDIEKAKSGFGWKGLEKNELSKLSKILKENFSQYLKEIEEFKTI